MVDPKDEVISAFAYSTGKQIEELINERTGQLERTNRLMETKILDWYAKNGRDPAFAEFFGIREARSGQVT